MELQEREKTLLKRLRNVMGVASSVIGSSGASIDESFTVESVTRTEEALEAQYSQVQAFIADFIEEEAEILFSSTYLPQSTDDFHKTKKPATIVSEELQLVRQRGVQSKKPDAKPTREEEIIVWTVRLANGLLKIKKVVMEQFGDAWDETGTRDMMIEKLDHLLSMKGVKAIEASSPPPSRAAKLAELRRIPPFGMVKYRPQPPASDMIRPDSPYGFNGIFNVSVAKVLRHDPIKIKLTELLDLQVELLSKVLTNDSPKKLIDGSDDATILNVYQAFAITTGMRCLAFGAGQLYDKNGERHFNPKKQLSSNQWSLKAAGVGPNRTLNVYVAAASEDDVDASMNFLTGLIGIAKGSVEPSRDERVDGHMVFWDASKTSTNVGCIPLALRILPVQKAVKDLCGGIPNLIIILNNAIKRLTDSRMILARYSTFNNEQTITDIEDDLIRKKILPRCCDPKEAARWPADRGHGGLPSLLRSIVPQRDCALEVGLKNMMSLDEVVKTEKTATMKEPNMMVNGAMSYYWALGHGPSYTYNDPINTAALIKDYADNVRLKNIAMQVAAKFEASPIKHYTTARMIP